MQTQLDSNPPPTWMQTPSPWMQTSSLLDADPPPPRCRPPSPWMQTPQPLDADPPPRSRPHPDADPLPLRCRPPWKHTPSPQKQAPSPDTINKRAVHILLECILVCMCDHGNAQDKWNTFVAILNTLKSQL